MELGGGFRGLKRVVPLLNSLLMHPWRVGIHKKKILIFLFPRPLHYFPDGELVALEEAIFNFCTPAPPFTGVQAFLPSSKPFFLDDSAGGNSKIVSPSGYSPPRPCLLGALAFFLGQLPTYRLQAGLKWSSRVQNPYPTLGNTSDFGPTTPYRSPVRPGVSHHSLNLLSEPLTAFISVRGEQFYDILRSLMR